MREKPRRGFNAEQTASMFYMLFVGIGIGFIALLWEMLHKTTAKRFHFISVQKRRNGFSGPAGKKVQIMRTLEIQFDLKTIVDGIYDQTNDVWVCFTRKNATSKKIC